MSHDYDYDEVAITCTTCGWRRFAPHILAAQELSTHIYYTHDLPRKVLL